MVRPTPEIATACHEKVAHFSVPEFKPQKKTDKHAHFAGWIKFPDRLLFAQDGIEVYVNARSEFWPDVTFYGGLEILLVYQDEVARQAAIRDLVARKIVAPVGNDDALYYLKTAVVRFEPEVPWESNFPPSLSLKGRLDKALAMKWHISEVRYIEPKDCQWMSIRHPTGWAEDYKDSTEAWIEAEHYDLKGKTGPDNDPLFMKGLQSMFAWLRKYVSVLS
jgi:hypothetical protein